MLLNICYHKLGFYRFLGQSMPFQMMWDRPVFRYKIVVILLLQITLLISSLVSVTFNPSFTYAECWMPENLDSGRSFQAACRDMGKLARYRKHKHLVCFYFRFFFGKVFASYFIILSILTSRFISMLFVSLQGLHHS